MKDKKDKIRTLKQNSCLHLMFSQLADELNDSGLYISQVIKFDAPWNGERVKELIWREVQKKMTGKESTTKITTREVDEIFEVIHQALSQKGVEIRFPAIETLMMEARIK